MTDAEPLDVFEARRQKLADLHAFPGVETIASVREAHADLEAGDETEVSHRVAGRLAARRGQGKMAFLDLVDRSGRIQLQARVDELGADQMETLLSLDLGDLIGVDGTAFNSRRGELSLRLTGFELLAKSLRPPPDKHHGLTDVETRFRHREADLLSSEETRAVFITRAKMISSIRRYLDSNGFIEVETPILQPLYGGAAARPFTTHHNALDRELYLRIAPELYLKRLIVGGLERVYEIGRLFRNEGLSPKHNPEFTSIEYYEAYADYMDVAQRFEELMRYVTDAIGYAGPLDFQKPWHRETLAGSIQARTGVDIREHRDRDSLAAAMSAQGLPVPETDTWPQLVDELVSKHVEPTLIEPTFLFDYPVEISPLAKKHRSEDGTVERFEAFINGMEVANAFTELNDPDDQRARFEEQRALAASGDEETQPYDEAYIHALEYGLPPTGGIGFGIDRMAMILTGQTTIREVVLFPAMRD
jgi:lysyl-tRNA synthetase class 2